MSKLSINVGDRVWVEGRKTALRVFGFFLLRGERAVRLVNETDWAAHRRDGPVRIIRVIQLADLVRFKGGWRERWRQLPLFPDRDDHRTEEESAA